ncbi:MAG: hypothetical protein IPN14_08705 [Bacteroidetes bacterium]|nr:hypothetical protein [Bacteroidota bacterium]
MNQNVNMEWMLDSCGIDCSNYSLTLTGWSNNLNTPMYRTLGAKTNEFLLYAISGRNYLLNILGWNIIGDTIANNNCCLISNTNFSNSSCNAYFFNGQNLTISGIYYDTLVNANGCDSLITLNLTINQANADTINQTACNSYFFNGQTITNSGTYYDTLMNMNGCDSLITLNLTINLSNTDTINQSACTSYFFNGLTLTNSGTYYDTLMNLNGCDSLITLFLTLNYSTYTFSYSACNSYFFNGQTITNSGTYFDTLVNVMGCDSIITLNLVIEPNITVFQSGASLTSNAIGASYQWLSCNPYQEIIGETNQNYIASTNGDYAVIVTKNGCTDTSACYTVNNVGIKHFDLSNNIKLFPNPVSQNLQIESATAFQNANIKILNITGLVIAEYLDISTNHFLLICPHTALVATLFKLQAQVTNT